MSAGAGIARLARLAPLLRQLAAELEALAYQIDGDTFAEELRLLERRDARRRRRTSETSPARAPACPSSPKEDGRLARARRARRIVRRTPLSAGAGHG